MANNSIVKRLSGKLKAFASHQRGNVTLIFSLSAIGLLGVVGLAVDTSVRLSVETAMQTALDATALNISWDLMSADETTLSAKANTLFWANFTDTRLKNGQITAVPDTASKTLTLTVDGDVDTSFMGVLGFHTMEVNALTEVTRGFKKMQVALVLDNTGSMNKQNKLSSLKSATHRLLDQLEGASKTPGDVMVSIVPFNNGVNIGPDNAAETWLDWNYFKNSGGSGWGGYTSGSWSTTSTNNTYTWGSSSYTWDSTQSTSTSTTYDWTSGSGTWNTDTGAFSSSNSCGWSNCWNSNDAWSAAASDHAHWQGCVMDRDQDYDVSTTAPDPANPSTLYPAIFAPSCPLPLIGLTYDWTKLGDVVDDMTGKGSTNQTIGLVWGWQSLTEGEPFGNPAPSSDTDRVIVLFTDGLNTENRWTTDASSIDARMQLACSNVKAAGVTIYAVQVKGNGDPTSTVLQNCVSGPDKFFALDSASQIVTAFENIGTALATMRLSR